MVKEWKMSPKIHAQCSTDVSPTARKKHHTAQPSTDCTANMYTHAQRTYNSRLTRTGPRPMHENAARAKTPHAHTSPKTAPRTHTQPHHTRQNLFGLHQKRTNSQHSAKPQKESDQEHKLAQLSDKHTPHPRKSQQTAHKTHAQLVVELLTGCPDFDCLHQDPRDGLMTSSRIVQTFFFLR